MKRSLSSWELLEAVRDIEDAERLLVDYGKLLEGQSEMEVVMVAAASAREARGKLEHRDT